MGTLARIMKRTLKKVAADASVKEVAKRMGEEKVGSLLVEKGRKFVGIVTETDIVRKAVAKGKDLSRVKVESIMSAPITTLESTRTIQDANDLMADAGIRHLAVTEGGKLVGLVSVRDLLVAFQRVSEPKITQD